MAPRKTVPKKKASKGQGKTSTGSKTNAPASGTIKAGVVKPWNRMDTNKLLLQRCKERKVQLNATRPTKNELTEALEAYDIANGIAQAGTTNGPGDLDAAATEKYEKLRVVDLKEKCKELGIVFESKVLKATLVSKLCEFDRTYPPSPAISNGPEFRDQNKKTSIHVPHEALVAARHENFSSGNALGFKNPDSYCYRNSLMILLLHSNRLLSWIKHGHMDHLRSAKEVWPGDEDPESYNDIWCELMKLANVFWGPGGRTQQNMDQAMETFWEHVSSMVKPPPDDEEHDEEEDDDRLQAPQDFRKKDEEQDPTELLAWMFQLSIHQLSAGNLVGNVASTINDLTTVYQTHRYTCRSDPQLRHRQCLLDEESAIRLSLRTEDHKAIPNLTLQRRLQDSMRYTTDRPCDKDLHPDTDNVPTSTSTDEPTRVKAWRKFASPPEILFVHLHRFENEMHTNGQITMKKIDDKVDMAMELDLTPCLETRGELAEKSAKYKLVGILCHHGRTTKRGHYITNTCQNGTWHEFDDKSVRQTSLEAICGHNRGLRPYLILYEKIPQQEQVEDGEPLGGNDQGGADGNEGQGESGGTDKGKAKAKDTGANTKSDRQTRSAAAKDQAAKNQNVQNGSSAQAGANDNIVNAGFGGHEPQSLYLHGFVQNTLGDALNKVNRFYHSKILREVYRRVVPPYSDRITQLQYEVNAKQNQIDALQSQLAYNEDMPGDPTRTSYYAQREAEMLLRNCEHEKLIEQLEDANEELLLDLEEMEWKAADDRQEDMMLENAELVTLVEKLEDENLELVLDNDDAERRINDLEEERPGWIDLIDDVSTLDQDDISPSVLNRKNGHSSDDLCTNCSGNGAYGPCADGMADGGRTESMEAVFGSGETDDEFQSPMARYAASWKKDDVYDSDGRRVSSSSGDDNDADTELTSDNDFEHQDVLPVKGERYFNHVFPDTTPSPIRATAADKSLFQEEAELASKAFADHYAAEHGIVRTQAAPWWWMGSDHHDHYVEEFTRFMQDYIFARKGGHPHGKLSRMSGPVTEEERLRVQSTADEVLRHPSYRISSMPGRMTEHGWDWVPEDWSEEEGPRIPGPWTEAEAGERVGYVPGEFLRHPSYPNFIDEPHICLARQAEVQRQAQLRAKTQLPLTPPSSSAPPVNYMRASRSPGSRTSGQSAISPKSNKKVSFDSRVEYERVRAGPTPVEVNERFSPKGVGRSPGGRVRTSPRFWKSGGRASTSSISPRGGVQKRGYGYVGGKARASV